MANEPINAGETQSEAHVPHADEIVSSLSTILHNTTRAIWLSRTDASDAIRYCYRHISDALNARGELVFKIVEDQVLLNGMPVELKNDVMRSLPPHMAARQITNFTLTHGLDPGTFSQFVGILVAKPESIENMGGFSEMIAAYGIENARAHKLTFKEISEDEVVVPMGQAAAGHAPAPPVPSPEPPAVTHILAFIKGAEASVRGMESPEARETADDPARLADLILKAAEIRCQEGPPENAETMDRLVVGCLRRACESMARSPLAKTRRGKKDMSRTLVLLEKRILDRMREIGAGPDEAGAGEIAGVIAETREGLEADDLATEYLRKRAAAEDTEGRLVQYIKEQGAGKAAGGPLKKALTEQGLSLSGWKELLVKSGVIQSGGSESGAGAVEHALDNLAIVLSGMEKQFEEVGDEDRRARADKIFAAMSDVNRKVLALAEETAAQIQALTRDLQEDDAIMAATEQEAIAQGFGLRRTRKRLLDDLSAIARNMSEPLVMTQYALQALENKTFGKVTPAQGKMLRLAAENAGRIKALLERWFTPPDAPA